jgi:hypothetical protein
MKDILELAHFKKYYKCKQCGTKLLVKIYDGRYIASSEFEEEFPGWCHSCLVDHCCAVDCSSCIIKDKEDCSFKHVKEFYLAEDD